MRARCGWQVAEAGSRRGLGLSSAVRYALPGTGRCQLCSGQDGGYRDVGTLQSPPCIPLAWAEARYRLAAPAAASRKDLVVLFRTRVVQLFQVIVVGFFVVVVFFAFLFFFLAFTHRLPQKLAVPSTLQEPGRPCTNTISIPLPASLTPCPAEMQDTTRTDQMDLSSSSTPSPKPSSTLHRVTPVPRSDPSCKYQSHQSRQSTAAESLGERHRRDSSQHGELSPRCAQAATRSLSPQAINTQQLENNKGCGAVPWI